MARNYRRKYAKLLHVIYSILFATMVYLIFSIYNRETRTVSIPISLISSDVLINNSNLPRSVRIVIKGDRDLIYAIDIDKITAEVNLSGLDKEGIYSLPVAIRYDAGILEKSKIEIYTTDPTVRVSLVRRPENKIK